MIFCLVFAYTEKRHPVQIYVLSNAVQEENLKRQNLNYYTV